MNIGIIRLSDKPAVALVADGQIIFVKMLMGNNLLDQIFTALKPYKVDELKIYAKTSIMVEIPDNTQRILGFRIGSLTKNCVVSESDLSCLTDLAMSLNVTNYGIHSALSYYKFLGFSEDCLIVDTWLNSMYLCAYIKNGEIFDVRNTTESNLEMTLNQLVTTYGLVDIIDVNKRALESSTIVNVKNWSIMDASDRAVFNFVAYCMDTVYDKILGNDISSSVMSDLSSKGERRRKESEPIADIEFNDDYDSLLGNVDNFADDSKDLDDFDDFNNPYLNSVFAKDKDTSRGEERRKRLQNGKVSRNINRNLKTRENENSGRFPWLFSKDTRTAEEKREDELRRELLGDFVVSSPSSSGFKKGVKGVIGGMLCFMFLGIMFSTVYKGKVNYTNVEILSLNKQLDTKQDFMLSLGLFSKSNNPMDKVEKIQKLTVNGVIEEVRYKQGKGYVTVDVVNESDIDGVSKQIGAVATIQDSKMLGSTNIKGVNYKRYSIVLDLD